MTDNEIPTLGDLLEQAGRDIGPVKSANERMRDAWAEVGGGAKRVRYEIIPADGPAHEVSATAVFVDAGALVVEDGADTPALVLAPGAWLSAKRLDDER